MADNDDGVNVIMLETGSVEYSAQKAATDINEIIAALEEARDEEGATHVVLSSGNHRGAKYMRVRPDYEWID